MTDIQTLSSILNEYGFVEPTMWNDKGVRSVMFYVDGYELNKLGWQSRPEAPILRQLEWEEIIRPGTKLTISDKFRRTPPTKRRAGRIFGMVANAVARFGSFINNEPEINSEFQYCLAIPTGHSYRCATFQEVQNFDFDKVYRVIKIYPDLGIAFLCEEKFYRGVKINDYRIGDEGTVILHLSFLLFLDYVSIYR